MTTPEALASACNDQTYEELCRLFDLYRTCNLNIRYYGRRAEMFERRLRYVQLFVGALAAISLSVLLVTVADIARIVVAIAAGLSAIASALLPLLGWTEKARDMRSLHFAYSQLFGQVETVITSIRRTNEISPEDLGAAKQVQEAFSRLDALDELEPDRDLSRKCNDEMKRAIPKNYLWTNF